MEEIRPQELPDTLYHYTSMSSLCSIIKDINTKDNNNDTFQLNLWATHIKYLNDPTEGIYQTECLKKLMHLKFHSHQANDRRIDTLVAIYDYLNISKGIPFICSLSNIDDDLSMWRSYGDNGKGAIIAFNTSHLSKLKNISLDPIQYISLKEFENLIDNDKLESIYRAFEATGNSVNINWKKLPRNIMNQFFLMKHPAYKHEKEYRLSILKQDMCNEDILYREKNGLIIPYTIINIPIKAIHGIILGPCTNFDLCKNAIQNMFNKHIQQERPLAIMPSYAPYRNM